MKDIRTKLTLLLNPYCISVGSTELSTEVKKDDVKAYQMYFIAKKIEGLSEKTLKTYKLISK